MRLFFLITIVLLFSFNACQTLALDVSSEEEWMSIYSGDEKIGYSHTFIKPLKDGTELVEESRLRMTILGTDLDVKMQSTYVLNHYKLQAFQFAMNAGSVELKAKGKREGDELKIEMSSVSGKTDISFPLVNEPLVSPVLYKWLMAQKPKVGDSYIVTLFDPASILMGVDAADLKTSLSVEGEEQISIPLGTFKTYRVRMAFTGSKVTSWITEKGEVIREVSPPGLISVRETKERVLEESLVSFNIVEKTAISSDVLLDNASSLKLLRVKVDGIESTEGLNLGDNNRQFYKDGLIEVRVGDLSRVSSYSIPYSGEEYKSYLKPSSLIQSENQEIIERTKEIVKGEKDSIRVVRKINDWVYNNLGKVATLSIPNALDVLETRKGDCNEHSTLFAALARAAGIPTKIVLGVVFLEEKFYYHAWDEVFVGSWIAVDPTLGQVPADASHIKFIEGDLSKTFEIIKVVGNIKLEIKDAS
jgi:hypothetical protein